MSLVLGFVLVFSAGAYFLSPYDFYLHVWLAGFWLAAGSVAALTCLKTAMDLSGRSRWAWGLFAAASLCWTVAMSVWAAQGFLAGQAAPVWADAGFLLFAPLLSAGLYYYHRQEHGVPYTAIEISQLGIFACCLVVAHIVLFYSRIKAFELTPWYLITALAYPVLYTSILVQVVATGVTHYRIGPWRPLLFLAAGVGLLALNSALYGYTLLLGPSGHLQHYTDVAVVVGFGFIYLAAAEYQHVIADPHRAREAGDWLPRMLRIASVFPNLALLFAFILILDYRERIDPGLIELLLPVGAVLLAFLIIREWGSGIVRQHLRAAVEESEARLRNITRIAPVGMFRSQRTGELVYMNDQWCGITGLNAAKTVGTSWFNAVHKDDQAWVRQLWRSTSAGTARFEAEFRIQRPHGDVAWVLCRVVRDGKPHEDAGDYVGSFTDISAHKQTEQALRESVDRFRTLFDASPIIMMITRLADGCIRNVNRTFESEMGWTKEEVVGKLTTKINIYANPEDRAKVVQYVNQKGSAHGVDLRVRNRRGKLRDVLASFDVVLLDGEQCLFVVVTDITDRKRAEDQMRKLSRALEQTVDTVMITGRDGHIEYVNPAFELTTGYSAAEVLGKQPSILKSGRQSQNFYRNLWECILAGESFSEVFVNRKHDGTLFYEEKTVTPLKNSAGEITHFVATGRDITDRIETQERMHYLAHHDELTRLPNRSLFLERLKKALAHARWHREKLAVLFLDIDHFKNINDSLGHDSGDQVLRQLAMRLSQSLERQHTVARFGGDEFVILLEGFDSYADAGKVAQQLLDALQSPFALDSGNLHITASIGISLFPKHADDSGTLLKNADAAMYRAKDLGRDNWQYYSSDMTERAFARFTLDNSLRSALSRHEFLMHYQPQIDARTGEIVGVEALLRWQHPELGLVAPSDFVSLLEDTGLIVSVGEWALEEACNELVSWRGMGFDNLRMAVNLSSRQFLVAGLSDFVAGLMEKTKLEPGQLELEITEGTLMHRGGSTLRTLEQLHRLGVRLAVDDFGTGYSSLSYLRRFPIDTLKIDRSFVLDVPQDPDDVAIVHAIVMMGRSLRLQLVAEGVETDSQRAFLHSLGCYEMQGYLFSKPLPAAEFRALLQSPPSFEPTTH